MHYEEAMDLTHQTNFKFILADINTALEIPFFRGGLRAGFPSPADDYVGDKIDLNKRLIKRPVSTFFGVVEGDSMKDAGIQHGDLAIIDRSVPVTHGRKILCCIDGEFTIKFIEYDKTDHDIIWLVPANNEYKKIKVTSDSNFIVWGVITYTITPHIDKFE